MANGRMQGYLVLGECLSVTDTRSCILPRHRSPLLCVVMMTHLTSVHFEKDIPVATLGTRRVLKRYRNGTINICKSRLEVHLVNTSVVLVLFGYSKGARKVSGKCIKGTPARYSEGVFKVPGCQSLPEIIFHGLPPVDKRNFWLTCLDRPCPVLSCQPT